MSNKQKYTTDSVISKDGTIIGYRQMGTGPGIILVHGGAKASQTLMKLGTTLSDEFTIYIPDRRGRGLSGPFGDDYGLQREVEDMDATIYPRRGITDAGRSGMIPLSLTDGSSDQWRMHKESLFCIL